MAFVALQFQNDQILVASARVSAKRQKVQHLFSVELAGDDTTAAEKLKQELNKHGLCKTDAIVVISRADTEMREIVVPPAPDSELPEMVRFIARSEFASLNENWALDYVPLSGDPKQQRNVLAAGISPEYKKQINRIIEPSGLKIKHMVLRPFASLDLVRAKLTDGKCRLIVDPNGDQTDMTIVDGAEVIATRTVRIPTSHDANQRADLLLSEVRRTLASSRKVLGDKRVLEVMMFGVADEHKMLAGNLRSQLDLEVQFVDPLELTTIASSVTKPEHSARFAALLGALLQNSSSQPHTIDFVNPRRPIVKTTDYTKWILYGSLAVAATVAAVAFCFYTLNTQATEIANLNSELTELKRQTEGKSGSDSVNQIIGEVNEIDQWKAADINWLEALYQYSERSLTPDDAIVDLLDAETGLRADVSPRVIINTRISEIKKESELISEFSDRVYNIKTTRGAIDEDDKEYPLSTSFRVSLLTDPEAEKKENDQRAIEYIQQRNAGDSPQQAPDSGDAAPEVKSET